MQSKANWVAMGKKEEKGGFEDFTNLEPPPHLGEAVHMPGPGVAKGRPPKNARRMMRCMRTVSRMVARRSS